ncbi:MAG: class I SAM-dependent methyltransferase [Chroococcales cyanobacterium]
MTSTFNGDLLSTLPDTLLKTAYQTFQQGKTVFGLTHKTLSNHLMTLLAPSAKQETKTLDSQVLLKLQQRLQQSLERDWEDAQQGVYPHSLLFDNPWADFFRYYPNIWLDKLGVWNRITNKQYQDFSPEIETEGYPSYYVQNFHFQTDGYLGEQSANLYDLQVEILFNGAADVMRRRILAPLKQGLDFFETTLPSQIRVLDVACGTGRSLKFIRGALPKASLFGVDLSPAYLRKANELLSENPGELPQLLQGNAEALPYQDSYFHGITSVFLFHELPPNVRQAVIDECFRLLQPGGVFVICDSMQAIDSPEFTPMMENFPKMFHEPYYRHYIHDDLEARLEKAGFENITTENHFVSKYWIAQKPM